MSEIRSQCEGCGMCCRAIFIPLDHEEFEKQKKRGDNTDGSDKAFVVNNWYPISLDEAFERNPYLKTWFAAWEEQGKERLEEAVQKFGNNFYGCSNLDEETGRCKVHEARPRVCSGYPWYGTKPTDSHLFYADDCYYKRDLIQAEETAEEMAKA